MEFIKKNWKGLSLCLIIAIPSFFLGKLLPIVGAPVFSILIGMGITLLIKNKEPFKDGITFTSKKILQYAVILLGFGLNLSVIAQTGKESLPIICCTISISLILAFVLQKVFKIPSKIATLIGVGSSICGGSAIAATAPVIDADDEEVAQSISVIFLFNVIAAIIFPYFGQLLGFQNAADLGITGFGIFAGTAVNDTSSVTATASTWDSMFQLGTATLDKAVTVKLTRTLAIIPITLVLAFIRTQKEKKRGGESGAKVNLKNIFPFFILYFVLASIITTIITNVFAETSTIYLVATQCFSFLKWLSKFFIIMAMAAIGLNTNVVKLVKTGGKPILLGFCCWAGITGVSLLMQHVLHLW
jgi:uncharacterized integral membrane protein (TIGR00698 family)